MSQSFSQRAPFNDWWFCSECLIRCFRTISNIYRENDEAERAEQALGWVIKLKDNMKPPVTLARKGAKTDEQKKELNRLEEKAIFNAAQLFRELLTNLPFMSSAIQSFLGVNWKDCNWEDSDAPEEIDEDIGFPKKEQKEKSVDPRIAELFWGPKTQRDEGIRSGDVEDGGLPGIIYSLLLAEKTASGRAPTEYGQGMLVSVRRRWRLDGRSDGYVVYGQVSRQIR